jgi:hypothetical protein
MKYQNKKQKKAQEEMVGFALIIIIVAIILLIFLSFSLNKPQKDIVESYEVDNFVSSLLQYTSDCSDTSEYFSISSLIFKCNSGEKCSDERDSCEVLNSTLNKMIETSWKISENSPIKGYNFEIFSNNDSLIHLEKGNITKVYKSSSPESLYRSGNSMEIFCTIYY